MWELAFVTELLRNRTWKEREQMVYIWSLSFSQILQVRQTSLLLSFYLMISLLWLIAWH